MKRTIWLILFGVLVFAGIIVTRMPVSWVMPGPNSGVICSDVDGTVWSGTCTGLSVQQVPVGDVSWELHAARLLSGKLNADLVLTRSAGTAQGNVETGFDKKITVHNLKSDLQLDRELVAAALPPNFQGLRGKVHTDLSLVRFDGRAFTVIEGLIETNDLIDGEGDGAQRWGSYSLTFPPSQSGDPRGQIKDLGTGPLIVEGSLRFTREPGFDLEGLVTARPNAPPELAKEIQFLGSPDAQGRRPFSLAGSF